MAHVSRDPYDSPPLRGLGPVRERCACLSPCNVGDTQLRICTSLQIGRARMLEREFYLPVGDTQLFDLAAAIALSLTGMSCLLRPAWPVLFGLFLGQVLFVGSKAWLSEESHHCTDPDAARSDAVLADHLACADLWPSKQKFSRVSGSRLQL